MAAKPPDRALTAHQRWQQLVQLVEARRGLRDLKAAGAGQDTCATPPGWHSHPDCHLLMRADLHGNVWEVRQSPREAASWWCLRFHADGVEPLERWGAFTQRDMALRQAGDREDALSARPQWPPSVRGRAARFRGEGFDTGKAPEQWWEPRFRLAVEVWHHAAGESRPRGIRVGDLEWYGSEQEARAMQAAVLRVLPTASEVGSPDRYEVHVVIRDEEAGGQLVAAGPPAARFPDTFSVVGRAPSYEGGAFGEAPGDRGRIYALAAAQQILAGFHR